MYVKGKRIYIDCDKDIAQIRYIMAELITPPRCVIKKTGRGSTGPCAISTVNHNRKYGDRISYLVTPAQSPPLFFIHANRNIFPASTSNELPNQRKIFNWVTLALSAPDNGTIFVRDPY